MDKSRESVGPHRDCDEALILNFLAQAESYGSTTGIVEMIETHAARVYLVDSKAFKIKKRVTFPYLDFSTLDERRIALQRELEINRPHAEQIYISLVAIRKQPDGTLSFGRDGIVVEYALEMNRFQQSEVLANIADAGPLPIRICHDLAEMAARYHKASPVSTQLAVLDSLQRTLAQLVDELRCATFDDPSAVSKFCDHLQSEFERISDLMVRRFRQGAVRRCHGDLHLGNIVLLSGQPVPFDALEFDEDLATIDVLHDLAFLLMDLEVRADRRAANIAMNCYFAAAPIGHEIQGLAILPFYLAARAAVRAVITIARSQQQLGATRECGKRTAHRYIAFAEDFLAPNSPCLIAIGGLSGTGKSTLAAGLAPHVGRAPGALHLSSDVERKRMFGVAPTVRLSPEIYTKAATKAVYRILLKQSETALNAGHSVILDAVSATLDEREDIMAMAEKSGFQFAGLWLDAPLDVQLSRVSERRDDASDANTQVVREQRSRGLGDITWSRIDAGGPADLTLARARTILRCGGLIV